MRNLDDLISLLMRHAPTDGVTQTSLARVTLMRSSAPTVPAPVIYEPALCLVAQGTKEVQLGERRLQYDSVSFLLGALDLPVVGAVTQASATQPFLCFRLDLDAAVVADLLLLEGSRSHAARSALAPILALGRVTPELLDVVVRLATLLDVPSDAAVLAPITEKELIWRLLQSGAGPTLQHMAAAGGRVGDIRRAVHWLRCHYMEARAIDALASEVNMSASAFHRHFKAVTGDSPVQFRARLRLMEARRLMMVEALDAADAGFRVGYGTPSQFSREYKRFFGQPPAKDVARFREGNPLSRTF